MKTSARKSRKSLRQPTRRRANSVSTEFLKSRPDGLALQVTEGRWLVQAALGSTMTS